MANRFSVDAVFRGIDRVSAPMRRIQNRVGRSTRIMSRKLGRLNDSVGRIGGIAKRGALVAGAAFTGLAVVMGGMIKTGMQFEQTITNAAAKFPGQIKKGTKAFEELEAAAAKVGAETEFSATQSAEALNFLAMAGFGAKQAIAALPGVVDLATAAQIDLATATDIATDSMGAFGLATEDPVQGAKNLARINDVLAKTATTSNTSIEALFETIKDAAPVATAAGVSLETFSAAAGTLANAGIKGTKSATTLKNMFTRLVKPPAEAAGAMKKYGIEVVKTADGSLDLVGTLRSVKSGLSGVDKSQKLAALSSIFGSRAVAGANVLLDAGADKLAAYRTQLENSGGAAKEMAATMRDTAQGSLNSLKSAVEGVSIALFQQTKGPIKEAIDSTTAWVRANKDVIATKLGDFVKGVGSALAFLIKFRKPIGIVIGVLGALIVLLKIFTVVMTAVNIAMAANPVVLITIAVIALVAAFVGLVIFVTKFSDQFNELSGTVQTVIGVILVALGTLLGPVGVVIAVVALVVAKWDTLGPFFARLWEGITAAFSAAWDALRAMPGAVVAAVVAAWEALPAFFAAIWEALKAGVRAYVDFYVALFRLAWDLVVAIWEGLPGFFVAIWEGLKLGVQAYIAFYLALFQFAWDTLIAVWTGLPGFFAGLWEGIKALWAAVPGFFTGLWDSIVGGLMAAFNGALAFVRGVIDRIMSKVAGVQKAVSAVSGFIGGSEENAEAAGVETPTGRTTRSISESSTTNTSKVVISDGTGRASAPDGLGPGVTLQPSGGF